MTSSCCNGKLIHVVKHVDARQTITPEKAGVEINISNLQAHQTSVRYILLARLNFHWPAYDQALLILNYVVLVANISIKMSLF